MPQLKIKFLFPLAVFILLTILNSVVGQIEEESIQSISKLNFIPSHYEIVLRIGSQDQDDDKLVVYTVPGSVKIAGRLQRQLGRDGEANETEATTSTSTIISLNAQFRTLMIRNDSISVMQTVSGKSIPILGASHGHERDDDDDDDSDIFEIELERGDLTSEDELEISLEYTVKIMPYSWNTVKNGSSIRSHVYETESGENRTYFSTLSSAYAYQLFPCVYDPDHDLLSTFQLTIIRNENYSSISNTEIISSLPDPEYHPGWIQDKFQITPPMTLDSLGFIVSDFVYAERVAKDGTVIRVHGPEFILDKYGRGNYTAAASATVVDFYNGYFNDSKVARGQAKTYPLKLINIVWTSGEPGMEKPGLIAYSGGYSDSRRWTIPPWTAERHNQLKTLEVIGPLLQQWFLPFISPLQGHRQWSFPKPIQPLKFLYIYLKELGMASLTPLYLWNGTLALRMLCTQEYGLVTTYFHDNYELCYEQLVDDASRWIGNIFATMRMLADENVLGKETIREAVLEFRRKLEMSESENGAGTVDEETSKAIFVEALEDVAKRKNRLPDHINISTIFDTWNQQIGDYWGVKEAKRYLIVRVGIVNDTHLSFTQERINGRLANEGSEKVRWLLPVTVQTAEGLLTNFWLTNASVPGILPVNHTTSKWVLVNPNGTSIHRTLYHPHLLQKLQTQLDTNHTAFSPPARIRLTDDYFHFLHLKSYSGSPFKESQNFTLFANVTVPAVLNLTRYLNQEVDLLVWINLIQSLDYLSYSPRINYARLYPPRPEIRHLNNYFRPKFNSVLKTIQEKDLHRHPKPLIILEAQLLRTACQMGNSLCLEKARTILQQWKKTPDLFTFDERLPPIKELLAVVIMGEGQEGFDFAIRWFFNSDDGKPQCLPNPFRRNKVLTALTFAGEEEPLQKLLNMTLHNSTITCGSDRSHQPSYSLEFVVGRMSQRLVGAELYRKFFYENCDRMAKLYPYLVTETTNILNLIPNIHSDDQFAEFTNFVKSEPACLKNVPKDRLSKELSFNVEKVKKYQEWMIGTGNEIFSWFHNFSHPSPSMDRTRLPGSTILRNNYTNNDTMGHSETT